MVVWWVGRASRLWRAHGRRDDYNNLGDGIRQTLLDDLTVDGWGSYSGRSGLEFRRILMLKNARPATLMPAVFRNRDASPTARRRRAAPAILDRSRLSSRRHSV